MPKKETGTRKNTKTVDCERRDVKEPKRCSNGTRKNKKMGGSPKNSPKGAAKDSPKSSAKDSPKGAAKDSPKSPDDVCSICLDVIDNDKYKTKCNHTFHSKCLGMWCKSKTSKVCPYCRASINDDCKNLQDVDSVGIMPYLSAMFFYTSSYGRSDVDKARADNDAVIKQYLDNPKFDPNVIDDQGRTPLHVAIQRKRASVVNKLLARKDIQVDIRDYSGKLAIDYALDLGNNDALAGFRKHKKKLPKGIRDLI
jgi:hypothetical protein